jgi:predicted site-specific integrase-resolvase
MKNLVTLEQYAKHIGVSLKTIYNHIKNGKIKPVIIGKTKFINLKK